MRRPAAFLLAAVALAACSRAPADPVDALLAELAAAAETRQADRFGERLSPGFHSASGLDRPEAIAELGRYFATWQSIEPAEAGR